VKAFVQQYYGSAERLMLREIDRPSPASGEVLVRIRATSVNPYDWHNMRGEPLIARLMPGGLGLRRPALAVLGCDIAGRVEAVGEGVNEFAPGDEVFGLLEQGGFAHYVCAPRSRLARMPATASFEQAAAMPMAATTALLGLREGGVHEGDADGRRVLVTGASGGVGTFAVQLAKAFGAHVTGVCGPANVDLVRSIGADTVVDRTRTDIARDPAAAIGRDYDLVLDCAGTLPLPALRHLLAPGGRVAIVGGPGGRWLQPAGRAIGSMIGARVLGHPQVLVDTVAFAEKEAALRQLAGLVDDGRLRSVIGRRYAFDEIPAAVAFQEQGHPSGKVVIVV
jgi:NADPH:quinone reductase-like Zn-dependent oxidoreductase